MHKCITVPNIRFFIGKVTKVLVSYLGHVEKSKRPGIHCSCMHKNNIYGRGSVNVSMNGLSHMPRSSTATVYGMVNERTKKHFSQLKW